MTGTAPGRRQGLPMEGVWVNRSSSGEWRAGLAESYRRALVGFVGPWGREKPMACWIVPPYILQALAEHGDAALRARALETLELSGRLAGRRMALAGRLETIARGKGERRTVCDAGHDRELPGKVVRREGGPAVTDVASTRRTRTRGLRTISLSAFSGGARSTGRICGCSRASTTPSITTTRFGTASRWTEEARAIDGRQTGPPRRFHGRLTITLAHRER